LIEGKKNQYGIPLILGNHLMLFYNKTLVEDPIESWEELIKQAPALSKANLIPIVFDYREPFFLVPFFVHYLSQSKLRNEQEKKVVAMSSALKFYRSLVDNGVTPSDCSFTCVEQFFLAGKSTYAILGDWALLEMNSKLGSKLGIKSLPWLEGRPVPSLRMPITLSFPVSNRQVNLLPQLKALAHFLQAEAAQKKFASEGFRLVSNKHVRSDVTVNSKGAMEKVWGLYQQAQPVPDYINPLFWSSLGRALNLHVDGSLDSNQASELIFSMTNNQMHLEIYQ
jgi:maltose-binding protein MalE